MLPFRKADQLTKQAVQNRFLCRFAPDHVDEGPSCVPDRVFVGAPCVVIRDEEAQHCPFTA